MHPSPYLMLLFLAACCGLAAATAAQDVESESPSTPPGFEVPEGANDEPSSGDTLFDESGLGNVMQTAQGHYHAGRRELQTAEKLARKAEEAPDAERRQALLDRRAEALERAAAEFVEAIGYDREMIEAYDALGKAYGELGKNEQALQVYAAALGVDPESEASFQGWAGSLLALDRLGDAAAAYDTYAQAKPERAQFLLAGMQQWLAAKQQDPGSVSPDAVQRLADWLARHQAGG